MYNNIEKSDFQHPTTRKKILDFVYTTGLVRAGRRLFRHSLTVLNYHRIGDLKLPGFDSFQPNVSADPDVFRQQMGYLSRWFNVVSIKNIVQWLHGQRSLPPYAAVITFDDGYLDNYTEAYPILKQYNFPAVIFLTTGHIDTDVPFYWDLAAYCFFHTKQDRVLFPDKTERSWANAAEKQQACHAWVASAKTLPDAEKQKLAAQLPGRLNVAIPKNHFKNLMANWEQVREMGKNGIEFGGHTIHHPILTCIPLEQARMEIAGSKTRIEEETGQPVYSFAYPNGMKNDLNPAIETLVSQAGYHAAFTLLPGPTSFREVRQNPFAIRRVFVMYSDSLPRFATLVNPLKRYLR
jgi:peptidoglycan/xylan/chitin deacetylase (PgdA/CDA1 family)